jgi:phytoene synthase
VTAWSAEAVAASHAVMSRHARSFRLASWFLAPAARDDAAILYTFCRAVDDAADDSPDRETALVRLAELEHGLAHGGDDVAGRVSELAARRAMPLEAAFELIEGARSDLRDVRMEDDAALLRYAYLVAGTVGSMMCSVLGARDERARARAVDLGIAMQLTNICRDVKEDAAMGRVYLPETRLRRAGTSSEELLAGRAPGRSIARVVSDLLDLADLHYASADVGVRDLPARAGLAVMVASRVYRAIGVELRRRSCDPMRGRVVVPAVGKLAWTWVALLAWIRVGVGAASEAPSPRAGAS